MDSDCMNKKDYRFNICEQEKLVWMYSSFLGDKILS